MLGPILTESAAPMLLFNDHLYFTLRPSDRHLSFRLHVLTPVSLWVVGQALAAPRPYGAWLGVLTLLVMHELGHATAARLSGARVERIDVHLLGGRTLWNGTVSPLERAFIASGGVLAQVFLLALGMLGLHTWRSTPSPAAQDFFWVLTRLNIAWIAVNLLPLELMDGRGAWRIFPLLWERGVTLAQALFEWAERRRDELLDDDHRP